MIQALPILLLYRCHSRSLWLAAVSLHIGLLTGCVSHPVPARLEYLHYDGRVNEHRVTVQAPPALIHAILTDPDRFPRLVPCERIRVACLSSKPYGPGSLIRTQTGYKFKISWDSRVVELVPDYRITLQFQNGIFRGGYEIWELEPVQDGTMVSHTILFNLSNAVYRLLWVLKNIEEKHNTLVEQTLCNLKRTAELEAQGSSVPPP